MDEVRVEELLMDNVNHPTHYESQTSMECIDAMQVAFGKEALIHFCLGNAFKYLWRFKHKNGAEDIKKAQWYLAKADDLIGVDGDLYSEELEKRDFMAGLADQYSVEIL